MGDTLADWSAAGEADNRDIRMSNNGLSHFGAVTEYDVYHTSRES